MAVVLHHYASIFDPPARYYDHFRFAPLALPPHYTSCRAALYFSVSEIDSVSTPFAALCTQLPSSTLQLSRRNLLNFSVSFPQPPHLLWPLALSKPHVNCQYFHERFDECACSTFLFRALLCRFVLPFGTPLSLQ